MTLSLPRRRFLALSAAAAAGATFFDAPRVLSAAGLNLADDPFGGFPLGVQSYSLRNFGTVESIRHIKGMGLHYAEFYGKHLDTKARMLCWSRGSDSSSIAARLEFSGQVLKGFIAPILREIECVLAAAW